MEKLEAQLSKPYGPTYPGGIQQYIDEFQVALAQLDTLEPDEEYSDLKKKRILLSNLRNHRTDFNHLLQNCKDDKSMTYKDTAHYLRSNCPIPTVINRDLVSTMLQTSTESKQVETNNTQQLDMKSTVALLQCMIEETSVSHVYHAMSSQVL